VGSTLYFAANNGTDGSQLWESNGTSNGTVMVTMINGTVGCYLSSLTNVSGTLHFSAYTAAYGYQVWQSNGTSNGTVMDTTLSVGKTSAPKSLAAMGTTLLFTEPGASLWVLT
jgi:ELWxxDGT repeat protein